MRKLATILLKFLRFLLPQPVPRPVRVSVRRSRRPCS
jgi:hypothetical protein